MQNISDGELEGRVRAVIARVFGLSPEQAGGDLQLGDPPQWDSIGHMQLLVEIEDEFGIRFPTHAIAGLVTVEKIVSAVREHGAAR